MQEVFISYREDDAKPWALLLRDRLAEAFGGQLVYLDKDNLQAGQWREQLDDALKRSRVVLVIIGRHWWSAAQPDGTRRLDDPSDVHRREIAVALARTGVVVIPVLVDGARMPLADALPEDLRALSEQQARTVADRSVHRNKDLDDIIGDIERATGTVASRASKAGRRARSMTARVLGLAIVAASWFLGSEIGSYRYRLWWLVFTYLVPGGVLAYLFVPMWSRLLARVEAWRAES